MRGIVRCLVSHKESSSRRLIIYLEVDMLASGTRHSTRPAVDGRRTGSGVENGHAESVGAATDDHRSV